MGPRYNRKRKSFRTRDRGGEQEVLADEGEVERRLRGRPTGSIDRLRKAFRIWQEEGDVG